MSNDLFEREIQYDVKCPVDKSSGTPGKCSIPVDLDVDVTAPIYFYYRVKVRARFRPESPVFD